MFPNKSKTNRASNVHSLKEAFVEALERLGHYISPIWFYDQRGSALFEDITQLPSYYLTRTEISILDDNSDATSRAIGSHFLAFYDCRTTHSFYLGTKVNCLNM